MKTFERIYKQSLKTSSSSGAFKLVYKIVAKIPRGKVLTYGDIAITLGLNPRVVGYALHANKNGELIPCHRVVFKDGSLAKGFAFGGRDVQKKKLIREGVNFQGEKVGLNVSLFRS